MWWKNFTWIINGFIRQIPLTFKEIVELTNTKEKDYEKLLYDVFKWGGLPQRLLFTNDEDKTNYLSSVYDSIILKDIVERIGIKDIASFNKVLQMMNFKISG